MREIFTSWPGSPETSWRLPNVAENVRRCSEDVWGIPWLVKGLQFTIVILITILACFDFVTTQKRTQSHHLTPFWTEFSFLYHVLKTNLSGFGCQAWEIVLYAWDSHITRIQYSEGINFDGLNGWKCWTLASKTFEWRGVTQDFRNGGPLEMLTITNLIKIKVLLHRFSNVMFNLHYMCLLS